MTMRPRTPTRCVIVLLVLASAAYASAQHDSDSATLVSTTNATTTATTTMRTTTAKPDLLKEKFEAMSEKVTRLVVRELYPIISELIYDTRLSTGCLGSLMKLGPALRNFDIWAVQMVDAMGRPHAGTMQGRIAAYGAYDQCLAVRHDEGLFQGKYCMLHLELDGSEFSPSLRVLVNRFVEHYGLQYVGNLSRQAEAGTPLWVPLYKVGACVPSTCQKEDLQIIIDHFTKDLGSQWKVKWCTVEEPVKLDRRQSVILCIFGVWISFILFGTGYDIYRTVLSVGDNEETGKEASSGYLSRAVTSFSLRKAFKKLMDMPNWGDYSNDLGFVHGMRVFSATWVILGHTHLIRDIHASSDSIGFLRRIREDFSFTVQLNAFMGVETFLVITGFLSGYLVMKNGRLKMSPILVIIVALFRRYIRMIVPMAAVMGSIYLLPAVVDGPMLREHWRGFEVPCDKNWWRLFLMAHNYVQFSDLCVPHYWYIAVDYQLAIVSTIILAAVMPKWPKLSLWLMGAIAAVASLATAIQTYVMDTLPYGLIITTDIKRIGDMHSEIYIKPYAHAGPLFVGVIFGCLAVRRHRMSRLVQGAAWALAATVSLAALLGVRTWSVGRQPERLESAFYGGLHRVSWGLGVSWVMYACATGRGGFVNKILAWPVMYPLGRLSFAVYLVHLEVLAATTVLGRELVSQQPFLHAQMYLAMTMMSYGFAIIVYLLFECPVAGLDNTAFSKVMPKQGNQSASKTNGIAHEIKSFHTFHCNGTSTNMELSSAPHQIINGFPDLTKDVGNGRRLNGYANSVCESDANDDDPQGTAAAVSVKL
ncbi:O-acyltransferase like protein-like [Amblyomma americanum]